MPRLAAMLRAGKDDVDAASILATIGPPAVQPLIDAAAAVTNRSARTSAIMALGWLGSNAQLAIPLLVRIAQNTTTPLAVLRFVLSVTSANPARSFCRF